MKNIVKFFIAIEGVGFYFMPLEQLSFRTPIIVDGSVKASGEILIIEEIKQYFK